MFYQIDLILEHEALQLIAKQALEKKTGARGLRAIMVCTRYGHYYKPLSHIAIILITFITMDTIKNTITWSSPS